MVFHNQKTEAAVTQTERSGRAGGVLDRGMAQEDGLETWEIHGFPQQVPGGRRTGLPTLQRRVGSQSRQHVGQEKRSVLKGRSRARGTEAPIEEVMEVGGPNMSRDLGERMAPDPGEQRRPVLI